MLALVKREWIDGKETLPEKKIFGGQVQDFPARFAEFLP
jgi:hypothetical protein